MTSLRFALLAAFVLSGTRAFADAKADALAEMEKAQDNLDHGEYDAAVARFNVARSLFPSSSGPYLGLGLAHARAGRCVEAIPFLEEYLKRKTKDPKPEGREALDDCRKKTPGRLSVTSEPDGADVRADDPHGPVLRLDAVRGGRAFERSPSHPGFQERLRDRVSRGDHRAGNDRQRRRRAGRRAQARSRRRPRRWSIGR